MHNEDDELPEDEEEILVYVEFDGSIASNSLNNEKLQLEMIGLDMEHPIMQFNGKFYEGTYHNAVGTHLFFEHDDNPQVDDPVFDATPTLKYVAKTRKVLKMNRIFVELKTEMLGDSNDPECVPSMEVIERSGIPPKYRDVALKSWEKMRDERMKALNDYLEKQRIRDEKRSQGIEPDSASDDDHPFAVYKPQTKHANAEKPEGQADISSRENTLSACNGESQSKPAEVDQNVESEAQVSSVVDPGPSTSKIDEPRNGPGVENQTESFSNSESNEDTFDVGLPNFKGMHKARIQATRRARVRKYGNASRKKSKKTMQSSETRSPEVLDSGTKNRNDNCGKIGETHEDRRMEEGMDIHEDNENIMNEEPTLESMESLSISQPTEESTKTTDDDVTQGCKEPESPLDKRKLEKQQRRDEKMRHLADQLKKAADERKQKNQRLEDAV